MGKQKQKLIDSWYKLSNLAQQHREAGDEFNGLAEKYYGVEWHQLLSLKDNDQIIDTIDYGIDSLTFKEFDNLLQTAIEQSR